MLSNNQTGENRVQVARLREDMVIGPVVVRRPRVFFDPALDRPFIGQSLLKRFALTIDSASRTVRFERDHDAPIEVPDFTTFGVGLRFESDAVRVIDRIPGTRAERVVPEGARVTRVNGVAAEDLTEVAWREVRRTAERLELEFTHAGTTLHATLEREVIAGGS